jgi:hydrogenase expression/formation protein HypD
VHTENVLSRFRDPNVVRKLVEDISELSSGIDRIRIMHVCGSHEHTATYFGLRTLLPENVEMISGPGCPVCVCSTADIREAMEIARKGIVLCTFGDMLRDRTPYGSLEDVKREGHDVRIVYSPLDSHRLARNNPDLEIVFFAVGFETTAAPVCSLLHMKVPKNFSILTSLKRTSPAVYRLLSLGTLALDGIIAPGHVSTIVGALDWKGIADDFQVPVVVSGFEPVDMLLAIKNVIEQVREGRHELGNEYKRLVKYAGNEKAQEMMSEVFTISDTYWRAFGSVPESGYFIKKEFADFDARIKYDVRFDGGVATDIPPGCRCHLVVTGRAYPTDCPLFNKGICNPEHPLGPCMVSGEGTCYIWSRYGSLELLHKKRGG